MAVFKIGDRVSFHLAESREQLVSDLKRGTKMYGWQRGEDVETTIENFALANPRATLGDLIVWTKKTGMIRLAAIKASKNLPTYGMELIEIAARAQSNEQPRQSPAGAGQAPRAGVTVVDAIPARLKTQAKKVAEPGDEPKDLDTFDDPDSGPQNPGMSKADLANLPSTDPDAGKPDPVDQPYVSPPKAPGNPLAARLAEMVQNKS